GVSNDIEAYEKLEKAMKNPGELSLEDFNKYFTKTDLDLDKIPFIKYFKEDGGFYLTSSIIIACLNSVCNASIHRMMLLDSSSAAVRIVPRHLYHIYRENLSHNRDTPVAIVLGAHPLIEVAASSSPPYGIFELGIAKALGSSGIVVKTPLYKIPVPVEASIILEGILSRRESIEGPFTDILGLPDIQRKQPVFELHSVYVSKKFPLQYHAIIPSFSEHVLLMGFPREAQIYGIVRSVAPGVKSVRLTPGSGGWLHAIVSINQSKPGEARNVGLAVITAHPSVKHVVVVDDDIDIDNPHMVEWAIATRVKGSEDIIILRGVRGSTLDPRSVNGIGDKVIIDATKPFNEPWDKYRRVGVP
ncbi:MAG: UbiD family decarboxylase, partial [Thermoprotei archaeon]